MLRCNNIHCATINHKTQSYDKVMTKTSPNMDEHTKNVGNISRNYIVSQTDPKKFIKRDIEFDKEKEKATKCSSTC